jgi:hypothetical protein
VFFAASASPAWPDKRISSDRPGWSGSRPAADYRIARRNGLFTAANQLI